MCVITICKPHKDFKQVDIFVPLNKDGNDLYDMLDSAGLAKDARLVNFNGYENAVAFDAVTLNLPRLSNN